MDNDLGRPVNIITAPVSLPTLPPREKVQAMLARGSEFLPNIRAATEDNYGANRGRDWDDLRTFIGGGRYSDHEEFNGL
jgi:hypothetical protein